jgi:WD40 repeat protein
MDRGGLDALLFRRELGASSTTPRCFESSVGSSACMVRRLALRHELEGHIGSVNTLSYDSSGRFLASAGEDCTLKLWDAASGRQLRSFDPVRCLFGARAVVL